jgi:hypothetical protein
MGKKLLLVSIIIVGLGVNIVSASDAQLSQLAIKHIKLTKKIINAYKHKNSSFAMALTKELESGQKKLGSQVESRELTNLIKYLNLCVLDIKKVLKKPYSSQNVHRLSDLSGSLIEGNRYIARAL